PMTPDFALKLGWAAGRVLAPEGGRALIGKDTRLSGYMFESALEAGFAAAGVEVLLVGVLPTPAIAYLARTFRADTGVVISASHNPFHDNGVKFFAGDGRKIPDEIEEQIEALLQQELKTVESAALGRARRIDSAQGRYVEFCKGSFRQEASLKGMRIVVDCAHGATYNVAPHVFSELGAKVISIGTQPDGLNINKDCGSTHLQALSKAVVDEQADLGIALDGDGDRCLLVDKDGTPIDGDEILYILANAKQADGSLKGPVVGTLMSNLGLELAMQSAGIGFERANVGDRYVIEKLRETGGNLGGESSGHILCLDRTTTGDGIVSALQVLAAMTVSGKGLRELLEGLEKCPQTLINVKTGNAEAVDIMAASTVTAAVRAVEAELGNNGRVLLRPSGTEPLIRVMVEGKNAELVQQCAEKIAAAVQDAT
ncbi:MAG: phosphoglucosamine mutase, partial [Salinisphaeraceae bacterium]|nr:phosphoglucosamine mutase [Salinisphaeraceae bacterium]